MSFVVTTELGTVTVPDAVLAAIATRAAERVGGVRVRRRRAVDLDAGVVRLSLVLSRGAPIAELAGRAQEEVAEALRTACGIETAVDVTVVELT